MTLKNSKEINLYYEDDLLVKIFKKSNGQERKEDANDSVHESDDSDIKIFTMK